MQQTGEQTYHLSFCGHIYFWKRPDDIQVPVSCRWKIYEDKERYLYRLTDADTDQHILQQDVERIDTERTDSDREDEINYDKQYFLSID